MNFGELYIGSKVIVKDYDGLSSGMRRFAGQAVTITKLYDSDDIRVREDGEVHQWYFADFERLAEEERFEDSGCMISFAEAFMSGGVVCG